MELKFFLFWMKIAAKYACVIFTTTSSQEIPTVDDCLQTTPYTSTRTSHDVFINFATFGSAEIVFEETGMCAYNEVICNSNGRELTIITGNCTRINIEGRATVYGSNQKFKWSKWSENNVTVMGVLGLLHLPGSVYVTLGTTTHILHGVSDQLQMFCNEPTNIYSCLMLSGIVSCKNPKIEGNCTFINTGTNQQTTLSPVPTTTTLHPTTTVSQTTTALTTTALTTAVPPTTTAVTTTIPTTTTVSPATTALTTTVPPTTTALTTTVPPTTTALTTAIPPTTTVLTITVFLITKIRLSTTAPMTTKVPPTTAVPLTTELPSTTQSPATTTSPPTTISPPTTTSPPTTISPPTTASATTTTSTKTATTSTTTTTTSTITTTTRPNSNSSTDNVEDRIFCRKICDLQNTTADDLKEVVKKLKDELRTNLKTTSTYIRSKTSAADNRTSSKAIGYIGVIFLCVIGAGIVIPDLPILIRHLQLLLHTLFLNKRKQKTVSKC